MTKPTKDPSTDWPPVKRDNGKDWSKAQLTILRLLWPMNWVHRKEIFNAVNQTYYDRRIRELRESGWQIETHSSGQMYRLLSHEKLLGQKRQYPNTRQKRFVRDRDQKTCQICGQHDENIQIDHKIPLERNGLTVVENLQLLCRACNVEKRGVCRHCTLDSCDGCPYAYPELYSCKIILFLDDVVAENLSNESIKRGLSKTHIAIEIVSQYFSSLDNN